MQLIVLAAGPGSRMRPFTDDRPKTLLPFMGRPLLDWTLTAAAANGITKADVAVVGGYKTEQLASCGVRLLNNPDYASTSMVGSMMVAEAFFGESFVMSYGSIVYRPEVLTALLASPADIAVVVDLDWRPYWERRFGDPLVDAESLRMTPEGIIRSIGQSVERIEDVQAQFVGLVLFRGRGVKALRRAWARAKTDAAYRRAILGHRMAMAKLTIADVLDELATAGDVAVKAVGIHGGWVEFDKPDDLAVGEERWTSSSAASPVIEPAPPQAATAAITVPVASGGSVTTRPASGGYAPTPPIIFRAPRRW